MSKFAYPPTVREAAQAFDKLQPGWAHKVSMDRLRMQMSGEDILSQVFGSFEKGLKKFAHAPKNAAQDRVFGTASQDRFWKRAIVARTRGKKAQLAADTNGHANGQMASPVQFSGVKVNLRGQTHELQHSDLPAFIQEMESAVEKLKQVAQLL